MKCVLSTICCAALCSVSAVAQKTKAPMNDQKFVDFAAQTDMVEANLGKLAQSEGGSQGVKDYGQMLVTDHTQDYETLQGLAKQAGLTVPTAIDEEHDKSIIGPMHALKSNAFDKKFTSAMITGHTQAIATYKKEATDAENADIRSYAQTAVPTLEKHLDDAKALEKAETASK
jgi:putative membrane protein